MTCGLVATLGPAQAAMGQPRTPPATPAPTGAGAVASARPVPDLSPEHAPVRQFALPDYLATAAVLGTYYAVELGLDGPRGADWRRPVPLIDEAARDLLVLGTRSARYSADKAGDYFWYSTTVYPVLLPLVGMVADGRSLEQLWQLTMINLQAYAVASLLVRLPHKLLGRQRPDVLGCNEDPEYSANCDRPSVQYVSFYGGHAAISITGASLACAHHQYAEPLGGGLADRLGCAVALSAAGTVFMTRLWSDRHWLSDQLVSIVAGFGVGYALPTLLYYRPFFRADAPARPTDTRSLLMPMLAPDTLGASWVGMF